MDPSWATNRVADWSRGLWLTVAHSFSQYPIKIILMLLFQHKRTTRFCYRTFGKHLEVKDACLDALWSVLLFRSFLLSFHDSPVSFFLSHVLTAQIMEVTSGFSPVKPLPSCLGTKERSKCCTFQQKEVPPGLRRHQIMSESDRFCPLHAPRPSSTLPAGLFSGMI